MGQIISSNSYVTKLFPFTDNGLSSGNSDLVVDARNEDKKFFVSSDPTKDIYIDGLKFVFSFSNIKIDGKTFGNGGSNLQNGIIFCVCADGGSYVEDIFVININEDLFKAQQVGTYQNNASFVINGMIPIQGKLSLAAGTGDEIAVVVRDDLTSNTRSLNHFSVTLYGRTS